MSSAPYQVEIDGETNAAIARWISGFRWTPKHKHHDYLDPSFSSMRERWDWMGQFPPENDGLPEEYDEEIYS